MADLYPSSYPPRSHQSYHRHTDPIPPHQHHQSQQQPQQQYSQISQQNIVYPQQIVPTSAPTTTPSNHPAAPSNGSSDDINDQSPTSKAPDQQQAPKTESKPQATFLTKLYALLERPENHHMIRWDPAGEHIIVERPEQLALHVLPSIYRQSRFASFSRQLNIYGFMRKVNLRNVDPAIDDPDASTWSHPTLNRHSPPELVANFKRRVPPRLPKPRKRDSQDTPAIPPPRSTIGMSNVSLAVPPSRLGSNTAVGRTRGFSAPGSFTPPSLGWGTSYPRSALPPLTVPSDPPHLSQSSLYGHTTHALQPITPTDEPPSSTAFSPLSYSSASRDMVDPSSQYSYDQNNWAFSSVNNASSSGHSGSLSSLLNPSSSAYQSRPTPSINTSYASPFSSLPMHNDHSASSLSPDSRPTTGYSISSVSSLPFDDHLSHDYSRPGSSHQRTSSPCRPPSSRSAYQASGSLSIRRTRRHSQAMSPYPSPYEHAEHQPQHHQHQHQHQHHHHQRPSSSPQPHDDHHQHHAAAAGGSGIPRVRSMIQLPSVDPYTFSTSQADFAYSAVTGGTAVLDGMDGSGGWGHNRSVRPSTSSSMSGASHTSSSQANTPPVQESYNNGDTDITRFSPDFGFVQMNEHLPSQYTKASADMSAC